MTKFSTAQRKLILQDIHKDFKLNDSNIRIGDEVKLALGNTLKVEGVVIDIASDIYNRKFKIFSLKKRVVCDIFVNRDNVHIEVTKKAKKVFRANISYLVRKHIK